MLNQSQKVQSFLNLTFRFKFFLSILFIFTIIIGLDYAYIMLLSQPLPLGNSPLPSVERGEILDRNGKILALSTKTYSVSAWLPSVKDIESTSQTLSSILKQSKDEILKKLSGDNKFVYLARKASPTQSEKIRAIQKEGRLLGISLEDDYARIYPERDLASQTIGFVGIDNQGLSGIEYSLNNILSPSLSESTNAFWINPQPKVGNNIYLTLDAKIQYQIQKIAESHFRENQPKNLFILLAKAHSGEILSLLQLPSFDLNKYQSYNAEMWQNLPVTLTYEPGSVFKIFTLAILLNNTSLKETDTFYDNGVYEKILPNGQTIKIRSIEAFGWVNPEGILRYSSNVGMAFASEKISNETFYEKLLDFGFGSPVKIPLSGESHGLLNHPSKWSIRSKPTISFGQEIGTSALQIIQAATALANKGYLYQPTLIKKIVSPEGKILFENKNKPIKQVIKGEVAQKILNMMKAVVERGSNWRNKVEGVSVSSKSGTAQVALSSGGYSKNQFITSILSIFPTEKPEYILYIVFEDPKKSIYGGTIAAPLSKEIIEFLTKKENLTSKPKGEVIYYKGKIPLPSPRRLEIKDNKLPNLIGLTKRELLPLLRKLASQNISFKFKGEGKVIDFNHSPDTPLSEIEELVIYFQ